jgi:hypothetical protein
LGLFNFDILVKVVTPLETGVQRISKHLKSRSEQDWIPAFAGMTGKQTFGPFTNSLKIEGPINIIRGQAFLGGWFFLADSRGRHISPANQKIIGPPYLFGVSGGWDEKKMSA